MNLNPRRVAIAVLSAALLTSRALSQNTTVPQVRLTPGLSGVPGASLLTPGALGGAVNGLSLTPALSLTPSFGVHSAPAIQPVAVAAAPVPVALSPVTAAPAKNGLVNSAVSAPALKVAPALEAMELSAASRHGKNSAGGGRMFDGERARSAAPSDAAYIVNDEGVKINGRASVYYTEVRRMVDEYKGKINLEESLDVMDDAYGDVLAKVSAVEAIAKGRGLSHENTHLEETLVWVDGLLTDGVKKVAVHTHRVFFHHAQNPRSEIEEGIRRVDGYIRDAEAMFRKGGKAESQMGKLDEVELVFDARGYQEIKDHIAKRMTEVGERTGGRIGFKFLDEVAPLPKEQSEIRARLNELAKIYNGEGLSKIYEGVIYSRYVGLLLELKTVEHYHKLGYTILQSGRELFDEKGLYVTELDVVARSPEGKVVLIEAKSARVGLPFEEVLNDKVVYKLKTYQKHRAALEKMIGAKIDAVVFAMDAAVDPNANPSEILPRDLRKLELIEYLRGEEPALSKTYGFPTTFLFLQSGPKMSAPGQALRPSGRGNGRKHGRR